MAVLIYVHVQRLAAALTRVAGATTRAPTLLEPTAAAGAHVLWELSSDLAGESLETLEPFRRGTETRIKLAVDAQDQLVERACQLRPDSIMLRCMAPDGRTAASSAELCDQMSRAASAVTIVKEHGIKASLCIPPERVEVETAHLLGAAQVSLHAGGVSGLAAQPSEAEAALDRLRKAAVRAHELGLELAVGHGLTLQNARRMARVGVVAEINLGEAFAADAHQLGLQVALDQARRAVDETPAGA